MADFQRMTSAISMIDMADFQRMTSAVPMMDSERYCFIKSNTYYHTDLSKLLNFIRIAAEERFMAFNAFSSRLILFFFFLLYFHFRNF